MNRSSNFLPKTSFKWSKKRRTKKAYICINVKIRKGHHFISQPPRNSVPIVSRFKKTIKRNIKRFFKRKYVEKTLAEPLQNVCNWRELKALGNGRHQFKKFFYWTLDSICGCHENMSFRSPATEITDWYGHPFQRLLPSMMRNAVPFLWDMKLLQLEILVQGVPFSLGEPSSQLYHSLCLFLPASFPPSLLHWQKTYMVTKALQDSFGSLLIVLIVISTYTFLAHVISSSFPAPQKIQELPKKTSNRIRTWNWLTRHWVRNMWSLRVPSKHWWPNC